MLNIYNRLHTATGGKIQEEKTKFFYWIWVWSQGVKRIKNIQASVQVNNREIEQLEVSHEEKTLGVYLSPSLKWIK